VPEEKIKEFQESFAHFDNNKDDSLDKAEFKAALNALGMMLKDDQFNKVFNEVGQGKNGISQAQYVAWLTELHLDKDTPEQLKEAFRTLADDSPFITANQLTIGEIAPADVEYLTHVMPRGNSNENYDYNGYVDQQFQKNQDNRESRSSVSKVSKTSNVENNSNNNNSNNENQNSANTPVRKSSSTNISS